MRGEDGFFRYAHLALQNHNVFPSEFMKKSIFDRAFMVASDLIAYEATKK